jgi:hypothetical protein
MPNRHFRNYSIFQCFFLLYTVKNKLLDNNVDFHKMDIKNFEKAL